MKYKIRLTFLTFVLVLATLLSSARLYQLQVVEQIIAQTDELRIIAHIEPISAVRGKILDRHGRPLVINTLRHYLEFDISALARHHEQANISIAALLQLTKVAPTVTFAEPMSDTHRNRLTRYLDWRGWRQDLSEQELFERLRAAYRISDSLPDDEVRAVTAVRYELSLRFALGGLPPYRLVDDIDVNLLTAIVEADLFGVRIGRESVRHYATEAAAHILGRIGPIYREEFEQMSGLGYAMDAIIGKDGMERVLEEYLRGHDGQRQVERNGLGRVVGVTDIQAAAPGDNAFLTLDLELQKTAEYSLARRIAEMRATGEQDFDALGREAYAGAVVAMDVQSGAILAMASYPTFDLAVYNAQFYELTNDPAAPLFNRAIAGLYAPGSTFKMSSGLALLKSGVVSPETYIYDRGRFTAFEAQGFAPVCHIYRSHRRTHGAVNIVSALQVSCNYYFYDAAHRAGIAPLEEMATLMGFGQPTGIELPGERAGILAGRAHRQSRNQQWHPGDTLQMAIGQSDTLATPLQMANFTAMLANGGKRLQPHIISHVYNYDFSQEQLRNTPKEVAELDVSVDNLEAILQGMRKTCQPGGTAYHIFGDYPVAVAGKTGSAQVNDQTNGIFVAFAPFDAPKIAIAVVVERGDSGGNVAPIARDVMDCFFDRVSRGVLQ
ncbi:MAG: penicillin-binding transpeptidase domain-containing protein [Oscillospiraceae bacterium]|nr:penicillin-binding transpeptidase domain-containing protein [Oscillospiraceae bacterium]